MTDAEAWRRQLAEALLEGRAETDDVIRVVGRSLPAIAPHADPATNDGGALGTPGERLFALISACAAVEALEYRAYHRPPEWPLVEQALAAIRDLEDALRAADPAVRRDLLGE